MVERTNLRKDWSWKARTVCCLVWRTSMETLCHYFMWNVKWSWNRTKKKKLFMLFTYCFHVSLCFHELFFFKPNMLIIFSFCFLFGTQWMFPRCCQATDMPWLSLLLKFTLCNINFIFIKRCHGFIFCLHHGVVVSYTGWNFFFFFLERPCEYS